MEYRPDRQTPEQFIKRCEERAVWRKTEPAELPRPKKRDKKPHAAITMSLIMEPSYLSSEKEVYHPQIELRLVSKPLRPREALVVNAGWIPNTLAFVRMHVRPEDRIFDAEYDGAVENSDEVLEHRQALVQAEEAFRAFFADIEQCAAGLEPEYSKWVEKLKEYQGLKRDQRQTRWQKMTPLDEAIGALERNIRAAKGKAMLGREQELRARSRAVEKTSHELYMARRRAWRSFKDIRTILCEELEERGVSHFENEKDLLGLIVDGIAQNSFTLYELKEPEDVDVNLDNQELVIGALPRPLEVPLDLIYESATDKLGRVAKGRGDGYFAYTSNRLMGKHVSEQDLAARQGSCFTGRVMSGIGGYGFVLSRGLWRLIVQNYEFLCSTSAPEDRFRYQQLPPPRKRISHAEESSEAAGESAEDGVEDAEFKPADEDKEEIELEVVGTDEDEADAAFEPADEDDTDPPSSNGSGDVNGPDERTDGGGASAAPAETAPMAS